VSVDQNDPRYLPRVLEQSSMLVRVSRNDSGDPEVPNVRPEETTAPSSPPTSPPSLTDEPALAMGGDDGEPPAVEDFQGSRDLKTGIYALEKADLFNLLCIPPATRQNNTDPTVYQAAMAYCRERRAMLIVDPQHEWGASPATAAASARDGLSALGLSGTDARNAALYFPRVVQPDPQRDRQLDTFVPCGIIAGVMARTDSQRGVWKAPAGLDAALNGIQGLQVNLTDAENGQLNPLGINCLRAFPVNGRVVWGARTLRGADQLADEYKYIPVRRLALFIEESLYRGTQWVVFEPNDEPLWAQIRLNIGAFMQNLFRQGAFQGRTPREAYFVKCDKETTTQNDINLGIVNILVGFAPLKPAEFVIIKIQQIAGQIAA
jgi:phage tail sheath protein FI